MDPSWLEHTLGNTSLFQTQVGEMLMFALKEFTQSQTSLNFIEVAIKLEKIYQHSSVNSQFRKCPARDIYLLLDIEEKGYIEKQDISNFIGNLEEAEVDNFREVTDCIWKVFELSDFLSTGEIVYTSLYIM